MTNPFHDPVLKTVPNADRSVEFGYGQRNMTVNAKILGNGEVGGTLTLLTARSNPRQSFHGEITCMTVNGNEAIVGGVWKKADRPNGDSWADLPFSMWVRDNGQGKDAPADEISFVATYFGNPDAAQQVCDGDLPYPNEIGAIGNDNLQVRAGG